MDADGAREKIAARFFEPREVVYLAEGWDFFVFEVDGEWIFRFPKRAQEVERLRREVAFLRGIDDRQFLDDDRFVRARFDLVEVRRGDRDGRLERGRGDQRARGSHLERTEEGQQIVPLFPGHVAERFARSFRFAAVPEDRFRQAACPAVVQVGIHRAHVVGQADAPQRRRAPFATGRFEIGPAVRKPFAWWR